MQFIPKKDEHIISCFRNTLQSRIGKSGINAQTKQTAESLIKISLLISDVFLQKTDIEFILRKLLAACYTVMLSKDKSPDFEISGSAYGLIDRKLLTTVLLELCKNSDGKLSVNTANGKIKITAQNLCFGGYLKKLCKKFGLSYYILKDKALIIIPFTECEKCDGDCLDITDLILNPLSCVNLWLR